MSFFLLGSCHKKSPIVKAIIYKGNHSRYRDLFIFAVWNWLPSIQHIQIDPFCLEPFMADRELLVNCRKPFIFITHIAMNKRTVVSKGDGKNYLGYAPDGTVHNMRKDFGGRFYKVKWNEFHWVLPVGDPLKKSEFTLVE